METADIPKIQESSHVKITNEDNIKSFVHFEFIPQGQTYNQAYYVEILKRLDEAVYR
jgi:hypothetical protein